MANPDMISKYDLFKLMAKQQAEQRAEYYREKKENCYKDFFNNLYAEKRIKCYQKTQFLSWLNIDSEEELEETMNLCKTENGLNHFLEQFDLIVNTLPRNNFPKRMRKKVKKLLK